MDLRIFLIFVCVHLLLVIYGCIVMRRVRGCVVQHIADFVEHFKSRLSENRADTDAFQTQVNEQVVKVRTTRGRLAIQYMAFFFGMWICAELVQVHVKLMRTGFAMEALPSLVAETYMFELSFACAVFVIFVAFPGLLGPRGLDAIHVLLTAGVMVHEICYPYVLQNVHYVGTASALRLIFAVSLGNVRLTILVNIAYTLANTLIFIFNYGFERQDAAFQYIVMFWVFFTANMVESWMKSDVSSSLRALLSSRSEATIGRLLSGVCDAVVRIGPDYRICQPTPKLAGLLLHTRPGALNDACFIDLVVREGRATVQELLELEASNAQAGNALDGNHIAPAVTCRMTDAYATEVPVELFASAFFDLDGAVHYIVGVKENGDDARVPVQRGPSCVKSERRSDKGSAGSDSEPEAKDASSAGGHSNSDRSTGGGICVWVNVVKGSLPVRSSSRGFKSLAGNTTTADLDLKDWAINGEEFEQWLLSAVRKHSAGEACETFSATLQPPHMRVMHTRIVAELCLEGVETTEESDSTPVAHLKINTLHWVFGGRRHSATEEGIDHERASLRAVPTVETASSDGGHSSDDDRSAGAISVWVDVVKEGLPVLSSSRGFNLLAGAGVPANLNFKDWVINAEEFEQWLFTTARRHSAGEACELFFAILQPPHMRARNTRIEAHVCLEGVGASIGSVGNTCGSTPQVAHLKLSDLQWPHTRRRPGKSLRGGSRRRPSSQSELALPTL